MHTRASHKRNANQKKGQLSILPEADKLWRSVKTKERGFGLCGEVNILGETNGR